MKQKTNEWEFQGEVLGWLNEEIQRRPGMGIEKATQEPSKVTPKRSDLVIWANRAAEAAFLVVELKTPATPVSDPKLFRDAERKAKEWSAPFFAVWNMQAAELYRTPPADVSASPEHRLHTWPSDSLVSTVEDWLKPKVAASLRVRSIDILEKAWERHAADLGGAIRIDASIFVDRLTRRISEVREHIYPTLAKRAATDRSVRKELQAFAAAAGFIGFVEDLYAAIAGQFAYRLVGQILFYFALRRKQPALKPLRLAPTDAIPAALQPYWNDVRRFDYEALFEPSLLEKAVPIPQEGQALIRRLISDLDAYDWNSLRDDVLGAIFEHLIPKHEQALLGQFYTPARVADVLVAFAVDGSKPLVLDPGCGSGTFLMRAYDYLRDITGAKHSQLLNSLWGFDISPLAAELAAINLFRQDMGSFNNFPRIARGSFFDRRVGDQVRFPPSRAGSTEPVLIPIPSFASVVGNPPYLRSQNQDDLDPKYRQTLFNTAARNGVPAAKKTDLFAFFAYKALEMMSTGARLGFVTSASWLTADFGAPLQRLLLERLKVVAIIASNAESFFSQVDVNTVLLVAEVREGTALAEGEKLRFVTLKQRLEDLFPQGPDYWRRLVAFVDSVEAATESKEDERFRIKVVDAQTEKTCLADDPGRARNWSIYLRAPLSYYEIFDEARA